MSGVMEDDENTQKQQYPPKSFILNIVQTKMI